MITILTTKYDKISNSDLNEVLGFTNKIYEAGMHLSETIININSVDKVDLKCNRVDGSISDGKRESILFSFSLDARPGYKIFKEPSYILFKKVNKDEIDDITFFRE